MSDADGPFEINGRNFLLTLKDALPKENVLASIRRATSVPIEGFAYSHEDTSKDLPNGVRQVGYIHTHFAVRFKSRIKIFGARKFDVYMGVDTSGSDVWVHPNIQKLSTLHLEQCMTQYLAGRKYDVEKGATVYTEPLKYECELPPAFEFTRAMIEDMIEAPSLLEACVAGQVRPRSVSDVRALRDEAAQAPKQFKHRFDKATFKILPVPPSWHFLHIHGGTGLGKTKWAVAQFKNPCVVKPFNSIGCVEVLLKKFDPAIHDGVVLDEADFKFMSVDTLKGFTDPDEDCTLTVRFKAEELPPIRKIAVSNPSPQDLYPKDPSGAIARRVTTFQITARTYNPPLQPPAPPPLPQPVAPAAQARARALQAMRDSAANAAANVWGTQ